MLERRSVEKRQGWNREVLELKSVGNDISKSSSVGTKKCWNREMLELGSVGTWKCRNSEVVVLGSVRTRAGHNGSGKEQVRYGCIVGE